MKFKRENGGVISIGDHVEKLLISFRQTAIVDPESGGMILGRLIEGTDNVIIDEVTTPQTVDTRERFHFLRRRSGAQVKVDHVWSDSKGTRIYLGEWHTHPEDVPIPSTMVDLREWARISQAAKFEQDFLLFIIVGRTQTRCWEVSKTSRIIVSLKMTGY